MSDRLTNITVFPDGGFGCLRCAAMTRAPTPDDGMRTVYRMALEFTDAHRECTGPGAPPEVLAVAVAMERGETGEA